MELDRRVFADRSERGKLAVTGPQRAWFLDQILTQKFDDIAPGEARETAMLTVHGRMTAYLEALATADAILCHYDRELAAGFPAALEGYVFATQVELTDVTDGWALVLVTGPGWSNALHALGVDVLVHPTRALGVDAAYLWADAPAREELVAELATAGFEVADEDELETIRIANGVPRWGRELTDKTFPQEAGIDAYAVHYEKGCYLGQEAMAKIHFRGKVNRRLVRLDTSEPAVVGTELFVDGSKVGAITSAVGTRALAFVKHTVERGTVVTADDAQAKVID